MICEKCHFGEQQMETDNETNLSWWVYRCSCPSEHAQVIDGKCDHFMQRHQREAIARALPGERKKSFYERYEYYLDAKGGKELDKMICWTAERLYTEKQLTKGQTRKIIADLFFDGDVNDADVFVEYL